MKLAKAYKPIFDELDTDHWICTRCIVERVYKPGEHRPTVQTRVYATLKRLIGEKLVVYSDKYRCRSPLCKSKMLCMVHRLSDEGLRLKRSEENR